MPMINCVESGGGLSAPTHTEVATQCSQPHRDDPWIDRAREMLKHREGVGEYAGGVFSVLSRCNK